MTRSQPGAGARRRTQPVRMCIGCRQRASKPELLRVVASGDATGTVLTPDLRGSAGGRGAHLHPTVACLDLAVRRKAFGRALRVQGPLDDSVVRTTVRAMESTTTHDDDQKRSTGS